MGSSGLRTTRNSPWSWFTRFVLVTGLVAIGRAGFAAETADAAACAAISNDRERLECYDAAAKRGQAKPTAEPSQLLGTVPAPKPAPGAVRPTALSVRWELDPETKQGPWVLRPHQPLFVLPVRYSNKPNDSPQTPAHPLTSAVSLDNTEAEFQLSFKIKAAENLFGNRADLWFGYTQQSQWQLYNGDISRPFRETDYQPAVFPLFPARYDLFGPAARFVNL